MPTEEQMERLIMLLDAHKRKTIPKQLPKKKMIVQEITEEDIPPIEKKPKKTTKKEKDADKEREIKEKMEQYLKPPAKKKAPSPEPAPASKEEAEPAKQEQPTVTEPPAPPVQAPPVPAPPKASEVQNITTIISEIKATIQPEIDNFKLNQINSFVKSYRNRHI